MTSPQRLDIAVLLAGVADSKWPLRELPLAASSAGIDDAAYPRVLSPFDEAALELALKLRDAERAGRISVWLAGGPESDSLVKAVGAHRPDRLCRLERGALPVWDGVRWAAALKNLVAGLDRVPDLLLVGREMGDSDDSSFPPYLAESLGWRFFGLAQDVRCGDRVELVRERGLREESIEVAGPLLASVTNDRRNRLRHPLLKNVMLAKKTAYPVLTPAGESPPVAVAVSAAGPLRAERRTGACRMLAGDVRAQAAEIARLLRDVQAKS